MFFEAQDHAVDRRRRDAEVVLDVGFGRRARRILRRLDFHYTPKHASWLNMVEIELSVLEEQCLARRIADRDMLAVQVEAWCEARNREGARIDWMFRLEDARRKMGHLYPAPFFDEALPLAA